MRIKTGNKKSNQYYLTFTREITMMEMDENINQVKQLINWFIQIENLKTIVQRSITNELKDLVKKPETSIII